MARSPISYERELGQLSTRLDALVNNFNEERVDARAHRISIKQTVEAISEAVRLLTQDTKVKNAEIEGALKVKRWLTTTLIGVATVIGAIINEVWMYLTHVK